ncbi:XRE family transcriptional regulator [Paenibacillus sp. E194]|uniref:XRE family transcriptional regulator n=1 Tax=Paenibacillus alvei TS-15 TaxID=1117108 RepID=S9TY56_PAEAL|nr:MULTISPECIES: helix-turn-helix transcriptional regulator [Paenibacillus]EPY07101.1 XRE family transcriptional regulator [Paenibacillus alvei TS-15]KJB88497.1 XRE family transcriptional regulator [Paenibacillus sp. E194]
MIRFRLGEIMRERNLKNKDVVELTNISRNTITTLSANATARIDFETINKLCNGLQIRPEELFEYVPDKK